MIAFIQVPCLVEIKNKEKPELLNLFTVFRIISGIKITFLYNFFKEKFNGNL